MVYIMTIDSGGQSFAITADSYTSTKYHVSPASCWGDKTWEADFYCYDSGSVFEKACPVINRLLHQHGYN